MSYTIRITALSFFVLLGIKSTYAQNCDIDFPGTGTVNYSSVCSASVMNLRIGQTDNISDNDVLIFDSPSVIAVNGNLSIRASGDGTIIIPAGVTVNISSTNTQFLQASGGCSDTNPCRFNMIVEGTLNVPNNLINDLNFIEWSGLGTVNIGNQFNNNGCAECGSTCPAFTAGGTCNEGGSCPTDFCNEIFGNGTAFFNAGPDQELCNTSNTTLAAEAGMGTWSTSTPGVTIDDPSNPNTTVSNLIIGDNIFIWDVGGITDEIIVTVFDLLPAPSLTSPNTNACAGGGSVQLSSTPAPNGGNYVWYKDGSPTGDITQTIFLSNPDDSGIYTLEVVDGASPNCKSNLSNSLEVNIEEVPDKPTIISSGSLICEGGNVTLESSLAPVGGNYQWLQDGVSFSNEQTISLSSIGSRTYSVRVISAAGCISEFSEDEVVTIEALPPTPSIASTGSTICADGSQIILTSDLAPDGGSYVWFKDGDVVSSEVSRELILDNPLETGNYTVQVIDGNGARCTSLSSSFESVEIFELPTTSAAGADRQLCEETSITLSGNTPVVGIGQWQTSSAGVTINDPNNPLTQVTGLTPGLHEFLWRIDNGACIGTPDVMNVEIFADPSPAVTEADKVICDLTTTTISADPISVGQGLWEVVSGTATIANSNNPTTTISNLNLNSNVVLSWTVTNGICVEERDELSIQVSSSPSAAETGGDQQLCASTSATLGATAPIIGNGEWMVVNGNASISEPTNPNTALTGLTPGENVTLRWTVSNVCGSNFEDLIIENEAAPDVANAGDDQELCAITTTTLTGSGNGGLWTVVDGSASFVNANSPTTTASNLSVGVNVLRYTIDATICDDTFDEVTITVFENPSDALAGEDIILCEGETVINTRANTPAIGQGQWTVLSGGGNILEPDNPNTSITNLPLGETILQWEISNGACNSKTDDLRVFIFPSPDVQEADISICEGESVELLAVGGSTYLWSPSAGLSATDIANPMANPTTNTIYTVAVGREGCDNAQLEVNVVVNPNPVVTVSDDTTIFTGQDVQLFARGAETYSWTPTASLDNPTSASPVASPMETTVYTVVGSNEFECTDAADVTITVDTDFEIFVPDLFSPNGDQVNDILLVNTLGVESFEFRIYDRKGRELFTSQDASKGWNGTFNGSEMAMDNYIYYVIAELITGERITRKGSVQLIR